MRPLEIYAGLIRDSGATGPDRLVFKLLLLYICVFNISLGSKYLAGTRGKKKGGGEGETLVYRKEKLQTDIIRHVGVCKLYL